MNNTTPLLTGEILFEEGAERINGATVYVRLEDVSLLDAPASLIAEQTLNGVAVAPGGTLSFALNGTLPEEDRARLNVRVHVSVNGTEEVEPGDYMTMESYPVLTQGYENHVEVTVRRV